MFHLIPSNQQENLILMLNTLMKSVRDINGVHPFEPDTIIVESLGMKHYVSMQIAHQTGVAFNINFPLLARGVYQLCRAILGDDSVPQESLYKREVLVWRIYSLLDSDSFRDEIGSQKATDYWKETDNQPLKRFSLAKELADVYEQYFQFRPEWINQWGSGESCDMPFDTFELQTWQRLLFEQLQQQESKHPVFIIEQAIEKLRSKSTLPKLPKAVYIFAVNAFPPKFLQFFDELARHVDIYFFYLNPCMEYWGDLLSDKTRIRLALKKSQEQLLDEASPNRLLANLGQQGRALFNQLQGYDYQDVTYSLLFQQQSPLTSQTQIQQNTVLASVQKSLLTLTSSHSMDESTGTSLDQSISVNSCHSEIREIQVLHDYLLHLLQREPHIKPHDIIVLCPAVEDYAPYVSSVFDTGNAAAVTALGFNSEPRIACSVADRTPLDSMPEVSMFMDLLALRESRVPAPVLLDYLSLPSIQAAFQLEPSDVELIRRWVIKSNIYWGFDKLHQSDVLGQDSDGTYSWLWGLERIMKGSLSNSQELSKHPDWLQMTSGLQWSVFGKLVSFLDQLKALKSSLSQKRKVEEWCSLLRAEILGKFFTTRFRNEPPYIAINGALEKLQHNARMADFEEQVPLDVIQNELNAAFSTPDALNKFNTGKVTFSSMVPMRSIPFKVVCILGLNDGVFPRINEYSSINLMGYQPPLPTDRSRKNEDRYLFLEAIISAREYFYLSYQGQDQYKDIEKSPSLVLTEFLDFLTQDLGVSAPINKHPLQPFDKRLFQGSKSTSFSHNWLKLLHRDAAISNWPLPALEGVLRCDDRDLLNLISSPLLLLLDKRFGINKGQYFGMRSEHEPFTLSLSKQNQAIYESLDFLLENPLADDVTHIHEKYVLTGDFPAYSQFKDGADILLNKIAKRDAIPVTHTESLVIKSSIDLERHKIDMHLFIRSLQNHDTFLEFRRGAMTSDIFYLAMVHCLRFLSERVEHDTIAKYYQLQPGVVDVKVMHVQKGQLKIEEAQQFIKHMAELFSFAHNSPLLITLSALLRDNRGTIAIQSDRALEAHMSSNMTAQYDQWADPSLKQLIDTNAPLAQPCQLVEAILHSNVINVVLESQQ